MAILTWFLSPVGRYAAAALILLFALGWFKYDAGRDAVRDYVANWQKQENARVKKATEADDASRRCAVDPACRVRDDGWRRD